MLLVVIVGLMLAESWLRWPDLLIDFGEELYVPWQITEGRALYRDIVYARGPLTPHLNALLFHITGPNLWSLVAFNVLVALVVGALLYVFFYRRGGILSATVTTGTFFLLFAFSQYEKNGTYNFAAPYAHEQTHAILLALGSIFALEHFVRRRRNLGLILAGLGCGLTFLTKPDLFFALAAAIGAGLVADWIQSSDARRRAPGTVALLLGSACVPPLAFWLLLCEKLPADQALAGVFRGWLYLWELRDLIVATPLARWVFGFDHVGQNLKIIAAELCIYALIFAIACSLNQWLGRSRNQRLWAPSIFALVASALMMVELPDQWWLTGLRALPFTTAGLVVLAARRAVARPAQTADHAEAIGALVFAVYALAMLSRIVLNARVGHYGFTLALPATLLLVHAAVHDGARFARRRIGSPLVYLGAMLACLGVLITHHLSISNKWLERKDYPIASSFLSYGPKLERRGVVVNRALDWIDSHVDPRSSLLVLPEGVMINFLAQRAAPPPFVTFNPVTFTLYGDVQVIRSLKFTPPDYVLLVHRDNTEHGARFFGAHFGRQTARWIRRNYVKRVTFGAQPFSGRRFGIAILARRGERSPRERSP